MTDSTAPSAAPAAPAAPAHLTAPLPHIGAWTHYLMNAEIPVLAATARALEELRAIEDDVDANMLTAVIQADPLMTLKLLSRMAALRRPGSDTETESVTTSLVLMGISPFFRHFGPQGVLETWLFARLRRDFDVGVCPGLDGQNTDRPAGRCQPAF